MDKGELKSPNCKDLCTKPAIAWYSNPGITKRAQLWGCAAKLSATKNADEEMGMLELSPTFHRAIQAGDVKSLQSVQALLGKERLGESKSYGTHELHKAVASGGR